jgi:hypothetical protein
MIIGLLMLAIAIEFALGRQRRRELLANYDLFVSEKLLALRAVRRSTTDREKAATAAQIETHMRAWRDYLPTVSLAQIAVSAFRALTSAPSAVAAARDRAGVDAHPEITEIVAEFCVETVRFWSRRSPAAAAGALFVLSLIFTFARIAAIFSATDRARRAKVASISGVEPVPMPLLVSAGVALSAALMSGIGLPRAQHDTDDQPRVAQAAGC